MKQLRVAHRVASVAVAAGVAIVLGGCGSSSPHAKDAASAIPTHSATAGKITGNKIPKFVGIQHPIPSGKALDNIPDMYKYVLQTGCSAVSGGWRARGTAQNTTGKPLSFKVLVFFTDAQARIVDSASTTVTVPADTRGTWTAERQFKAPRGTKCVVRAVTRG